MVDPVERKRLDEARLQLLLLLSLLKLKAVSISISARFSDRVEFRTIRVVMMISPMMARTNLTMDIDDNMILH